MLDVLLHIVGAGLMMVPVLLNSTPLWLSFPWAAAVCLFWFARELAQDREKRGYWRSPAEWSGWKWAEAAAPMITAMAFAVASVFLKL